MKSLIALLAVSIERKPTWGSIDNSTYRFALIGAEAERARLSPELKKKAVIMATLVGFLDTPDPPLSSGYGHLDEFPAQLIVYAIKDIVIMVDGRPVNPAPIGPSIDR